MINDKSAKVRLFPFYLWIAHPTGTLSLTSVLAHLENDDLLHIMLHDTVEAATIAWAEYGRRRDFAAINFHMNVLDVLEVGVTDLIMSAQLSAASA